MKQKLAKKEETVEDSRKEKERWKNESFKFERVREEKERSNLVSQEKIKAIEGKVQHWPSIWSPKRILSRILTCYFFYSFGVHFLLGSREAEH